MQPTWVPPMARPLPAPPEVEQNSHLTCDSGLPKLTFARPVQAGGRIRNQV